jgi:hypothetical protein
MRKAITGLALAALVALAPGAEAATASCTFRNAAYPGKCVESEEIPEGSTAEQVCQSILACLNDVRCIKTYCNATEVRSGWVLVSVERAPPAGGKSPSGKK